MITHPPTHATAASTSTAEPLERIPFEDLPREAQAVVAQHSGDIVATDSGQPGVGSAVAAVVRGERTTVFVKGIPLGHPQAVVLQREADINPHLPKRNPKLLRRVLVGGWDLLIFEYLDGRAANFSPGSADLPLMVTAFEELASTPCPDMPLKYAAQRWVAYTHAWAVPTLVGNCLLHTDPAPHNALIRGGTAHLVDWAWPTRGAAWIDPALWVIRLIDAGHDPGEAESWAARLPAFRSVMPVALDAFASANTLLWAEIARESGGGAWQSSMAASARRWSDHRFEAAR